MSKIQIHRRRNGELPPFILITFMTAILVSRAATCSAAPQKINGYFVGDTGVQGRWDSDELEPGTPAGYMSPDIPDFDAPQYSGQHYEALVPDTLDLAERARLAIHFLTESPLPWCDYDMCAVNLAPYPRMLSAGYSSADVTVKLKEAVCMARLMSGSKQNLHVDRRWMEVILMQQGPDGLIYMLLARLTNKPVTNSMDSSSGMITSSWTILCC